MKPNTGTITDPNVRIPLSPAVLASLRETQTTVVLSAKDARILRSAMYELASKAGLTREEWRAVDALDALLYSPQPR